MVIIASGIVLICIILLFGPAVGITIVSLVGAALLLFVSSAVLVGLGVDFWIVVVGIIALFLLVFWVDVQKGLRKTEKSSALKKEEDQALRDFRKLFDK